jgi:hypothetical protein
MDDGKLMRRSKGGETNSRDSLHAENEGVRS